MYLNAFCFLLGHYVYNMSGFVEEGKRGIF